MVTAADKKYAPYMFNMLSSLHANFPLHPVVYVFNLGMTRAQCQELLGVPWLALQQVEKFAPHWKLNWAWKPYIWLQPAERYVLHLDAGIVVLRSLELWFLSIKKNMYLAISQNQPMSDITPLDYWSLVGLEKSRYENEEVFAAGVWGFDKRSIVGKAVQEAYQLAKEGWTLGASEGEVNPAFDKSIIRNCPRFRHDQTLINLTLRKHIKQSVVVRPLLKYCGLGGSNESPQQFIWLARRRPDSMKFFWKPMHRLSIVFYYNRITSLPRIIIAPYKGRFLSLIRRLSLNNF